MNTNAKHTPGPWNPLQAPLDCGGYWWIQGPEKNGCRDLATLSRNFSTEANARLIAAAPNMYEALKYAKEIIDIAKRYFPKSATNGDKYSLLNLDATISKAIRKAEGGAQDGKEGEARANCACDGLLS